MSTEEGRAWIPNLVADGRRAIAARLIRSVLSRVEHEALNEVSESKLPIQQHVWTRWDGRRTQGHVLVVRLVGGGASPHASAGSSASEFQAA